MRCLLIAILVLVAALPSMAGRRDPLTSKETDQMRDAAQDGDERLKLLAKFARARLAAIEQLHGDSKIPERDDRIHELLEDLTQIITELDRNVDMYSRERYDLRKGLKIEIEALTEFQLKLRSLKKNSSEGELHVFGFSLDSALEEVNANLDSARSSMDSQERQREESKKKKH